MGHNRSAGLPQYLQRQCPHRNRHYVLHNNPAQDALLYGQLDTANGAHFVPLRSRILPPGRGGRKSDVRNQHFALAGRVPFARIQNPSAHLARTPAHRQISSVYFHHEHGVHSGNRNHHQLEFQGTPNSSDASLDPCRLPLLFADYTAHEAAEKDEAALDDGDAGYECASSSLRFAGGIT